MNSPAPGSSGQLSGKSLVLLLLAAVAGVGAWAFLLKRDLATVNEALAASILSPDQMTVLRTTQENQLRSLRAGAEMARQMLGAPQKQ